MLGVDAPVSLELLRQIVLGILVNTIVALPMWAIVRRSLEGALPEDPRRRRRRRAYTTGGLSPLSAAMSAIERVRPSDPRVPVSPQLALRVAILGGIAMVMFASSSSASGTCRCSPANSTSSRPTSTACATCRSPRRAGEILDREGQRDRRRAARPTPCRSCPRRCRRRAPRARRSTGASDACCGMSPRRIEAIVERGADAVRYAPVTIKTDAGRGRADRARRAPDEFPGVSQQPVSIRAYPYGEMAAQVLGHVDQISEPELKLRAFRGVPPGTIVGQEGLEYYYDRYLRGSAGVQRVEVNAAGQPGADASSRRRCRSPGTASS